MLSVLRDARFAARGLWRNPGFALVVISTLALGIGANTAIFSVVYNVLFKPLPYQDSGELMAIWSRFLPESGFDFPYFPVAPPEFFDYEREAAAMEEVAAHYSFGATLTGGEGEPERVRGVAVSANLFSVLGVGAALGRTFAVEEDVPRGPSLAVLSHSIWERRYGADPDIIGRTITVNGRSAEVVGVMPAGFAFPQADVALYVALGLDPQMDTNRRAHYLAVLGRLADGASLQTAQAEMQSLMFGWKQEYPDIHTGHFLIMRPLLDQVVASARPALLVLLAAVGFVLVVVCANVANLLLVRGEGRRREIALRAALGAGHWRIFRQLITESAVLSLLGGGLGFLIATFGVDLILSFEPGVIPRAERIGLDGVVYLFAAVVTALTAVAFGLVPALQARGGHLRNGLVEGGRTGTTGRSRLRFRRALVVVQVAVSLMLAISAALLIKSFAGLLRVAPGFRAENLLVAELSLPSRDYPEPQRVTEFYADLRDRLNNLPGVVAASGLSSLPLQETPPNVDFTIEGRPPRTEGELARSGDRIVALPGLTRSLGIRLLEGRFFDDADRAGTLPVAVINRTLARTFWPEGSPLGKRIRQSDEAPWLTIVGVIDDMKYAGLTAEGRPAWYVPHAQAAESIDGVARTITVTLRTAGDPVALSPALRRVVRELDPDLPITGLRSMNDVLAASVARPRFTMSLMILFAGLALTLGAVGIYGVISYTVARRTQELGIRMALGAEPGRLARKVVGEGARLTMVGLIVGAIGAAAGTRLLSALLFGVSAMDPTTFIVAAALLTGVALIASWVPARRATRIDPAIALRRE